MNVFSALGLRKINLGWLIFGVLSIAVLVVVMVVAWPLLPQIKAQVGSNVQLFDYNGDGVDDEAISTGDRLTGGIYRRTVNLKTGGWITEYYKANGELDQVTVYELVSPPEGGNSVPVLVEKHVDTDGDGTIDTILVDDNKDGTFDEKHVDTDNDGDLDTHLDPGDPSPPTTPNEPDATDTPSEPDSSAAPDPADNMTDDFSE